MIGAADVDVEQFRTSGYLVCRCAIETEPLIAEVDVTLRAGVRAAFTADVGGQPLRAVFVPMMSERTPISLRLVGSLAPVAATLLDGPVLPVRAKCVRYGGDTAWHRDSILAVASVGLLCYLDPLTAATGALRVIPGSHRDDVGRSPADGVALETEPGDLIVMDEHLLHASEGGAEGRRQWRVDFVGDGPDADLCAYFAAIFPPDFEGGYDGAAFPSYGPHWQSSGLPGVERLEQLGVYELAQGQDGLSPRSPA
jgi:Phytanoyl-CoA dioxygenase (PhyH)